MSSYPYVDDVRVVPVDYGNGISIQARRGAVRWAIPITTDQAAGLLDLLAEVLSMEPVRVEEGR